MLPADGVMPYEVIGFATVLTALAVGLPVAAYLGRAVVIRLLTFIINAMWRGCNPKNERPGGIRGFVAFYANVALRLIKLKKPIAWRYRTYKEMVD